MLMNVPEEKIVRRIETGECESIMDSIAVEYPNATQYNDEVHVIFHDVYDHIIKTRGRKFFN